MRATLRNIVCATALLAAGPTALRADGGGMGDSSGAGRAQDAPADRFAPVRGYIAGKRWPEAIAELKKLEAPKDADWNNLMGFCARRSDPPDLAAAERYYQAALAINPKHLGTLEYLGEMRLQQGNLAGAEEELKALGKATFLKSREYKELQQAIASFKASGGRYVPED